MTRWTVRPSDESPPAPRGRAVVRRHYHAPDLVLTDGMPPDDRRRVTATVLEAINRAVRTAAPDENSARSATAPAAQEQPSGARPETGWPERATFETASYGDKPTPTGAAVTNLPATPKIPRVGGPQLPPGTPGPTYGNMPREQPGVVRRVILREIGGKWREVDVHMRVRRAAGTYAFVIQDGTVFAVKRNWLTIEGRPAGHTEAAGGGRVSWAGMVTISKGSGKITLWNDASGHYQPAASLRQTAIDAGFPESAWRQVPETLARPRPADVNPQLPVVQPATRSRDGSPAKIPAGPSRADEFEQLMRSRRASPPTGGAAPAPPVPPRGTQTVRRVTFSYDTESATSARSVRLRSIAIGDFPPPRTGRVTRFFHGKELVTGLTRMVPSAVAGDLSDAALSLVEGHFVDAATRARKDASEYFGPGQQILATGSLAELAAAADDVLEGRAASVAPGRTVQDNLTDVIAYYDALIDMMGELQRYQAEGRPIVADLSQRAQVLRDVVLSAEDAFAWINIHVPVLFAYYQSFSLWRAREIFLGLAERVSAVERLVDARMDEYKALEEELTRELAELKDSIGDPHTYFDRLVERSRRPRGR